MCVLTSILPCVSIMKLLLVFTQTHFTVYSLIPLFPSHFSLVGKGAELSCSSFIQTNAMNAVLISELGILVACLPILVCMVNTGQVA